MKSKRIIPIILFVVVSVGVVLLLGLNGPRETEPSPTNDASPSAEETTTPESAPEEPLTAEAEVALARTTAENTATSFMQVVMDNATTQLGEETANAVSVGAETATADAEGTPASVAIIYLVGIPATFDIQGNIDYVQSQLDELNTAGSGSKWTLLQAEEGIFDPESGVLNAVKIWDSVEEPENASIVEISYNTAADGTVEIYISATVY